MSQMTDLHIIVAIAEDGAIGKGGDMPWGRSLPRDLAHFKSTTMSYPIVMGRKTFESLPKGALPGRLNIVVTRNLLYRASGVEVVHSLNEALELCKAYDRAFLIGGGELYREGLALASELHITQVHHSWEGADTYFPPLDLSEWEVIQSESHAADEKNAYDVTFVTFRRRLS